MNMSIIKRINYAGLLTALAIASLPTIAHAEAIPDCGSIPFTAFDKDGNGFISEKEFNTMRADHMSAKSAEGRPMRDTTIAPSFSVLDINSDGQLSSNEFAMAQKMSLDKKQLNLSNNSGSQEAVYDSRKLVIMPEKAKYIVRKNMQANVAALNSIINYLASNDFKSAAEVAESVMGESTMGKHRGSNVAPGRFMPNEMRSLGRNMHKAASEFAEVAEQGDVKNALKYLGKLTNSCVACHYSFRIR